MPLMLRHSLLVKEKQAHPGRLPKLITLQLPVNRQLRAPLTVLTCPLAIQLHLALAAAPAVCCVLLLQVTFVPDASVFSAGIAFDADTVASRLRELAFLNAGATMKLRFMKHGQPVPAGGSGSSARRAAKAAAGNGKQEQQPSKKRGKRSSTQQQEEAAVAAADVAGSNGSSDAVAAAEQQQQPQLEWQLFHAQEGLKEYVQW